MNKMIFVIIFLTTLTGCSSNKDELLILQKTVDEQVNEILEFHSEIDRISEELDYSYEQNMIISSDIDEKQNLIEEANEKNSELNNVIDDLNNELESIDDRLLNLMTPKIEVVNDLINEGRGLGNQFYYSFDLGLDTTQTYINENGMEFARVANYDIRTLSDFKDYLMSVYTEEIAEQLLSMDNRIEEHDGKLYAWTGYDIGTEQSRKATKLLDYNLDTMTFTWEVTYRVDDYDEIYDTVDVVFIEGLGYRLNTLVYN